MRGTHSLTHTVNALDCRYIRVGALIEFHPQKDQERMDSMVARVIKSTFSSSAERVSHSGVATGISASASRGDNNEKEAK